MEGRGNQEFLNFLLERFRIERAKFDRSGVYAYTQRLLAYNSNKIEGSRLILFRECLKGGIIPAVIEDANRDEYLEALKEYRERERLDKLIELLQKEQAFYLDKCQYFM